jgi:hypothetical protein
VLMRGLVDGETVVAVVMVVTTETNDAVVDADVVERLDAVVCADVVEQTDVFFLAFSESKSRSGSVSESGIASALWSNAESSRGPVKRVAALDASSSPAVTCSTRPAGNKSGNGDTGRSLLRGTDFW